MAYQLVSRHELEAHGWQTVYIPSEGDACIGKNYSGQQLNTYYKTSIRLNSTNNPDMNIGIIGNEAFKNEKHIADIDLSGVRGIRSSSFANSGIETIHFPSSVCDIGDHACANCSELKDVFIGNEVQEPEKKKGFFQKIFNKESTEFDPNAHVFRMQTSLEHIPCGCFENCNNLETIVIGKGVKTIDPTAFHGCHNLRHIVVCDGANADLFEQVKTAAIQSENYNNIYISNTPAAYSQNIDMIKFEKQQQESVNVQKEESFTYIPESVQREKPKFAYGQIFTTKALVDNGYAIINDRKELMMIKTLPNIDAKIIIDSHDSDSRYKIKGFANDAFKYQSGIKEVIMMDPIDTIGDNAFLGSGIKEIYIPSSVHTIGNNICFNCPNLETVNVEGCKKISPYAFGSCPNLKTVSISKVVEEVDPSAFVECENLQKITCPNHLCGDINTAARHAGADSLQISTTDKSNEKNQNHLVHTSTGLEL